MTINVTPIPRLTTLTTPAFSLGTTNAAGDALTAVASNSTLLAFDALVPDAITFGQSGAVGSANVTARRDHAHAMAADPAEVVLIGTAVASDSATLTVTGITSDYDTYMISMSDILPANSGVSGALRFGDSSGIDSGSSDYNYYTAFGGSDAATFQVGVNTGASSIQLALEGVGNGATDGMAATFYLNRPTDGTTKPMIWGNHVYWKSTSIYGGYVLGARNAVISLDRIQLSWNTGNITSGRITVWGFKHA